MHALQKSCICLHNACNSAAPGQPFVFFPFFFASHLSADDDDMDICQE
jgi:hypothetical protein